MPPRVRKLVVIVGTTVLFGASGAGTPAGASTAPPSGGDPPPQAAPAPPPDAGS